MSGPYQFEIGSFVLLEPDEAAQSFQIHFRKLDYSTCKRTLCLVALHYQNNTATIDDAEQTYYLVQLTSCTISMQSHSLEQLQVQNYMQLLNDTVPLRCLV